MMMMTMMMDSEDTEKGRLQGIVLVLVLRWTIVMCGFTDGMMHAF